jgi:D-lactate dehydrogenase
MWCQIALRSVGSDNVDKKSKSSGNRGKRSAYYYSVAEHAVTLLLALNRKIILGQNSCKWATTGIIWLVLTLHGKSRNYWNRENRRRFCKIMHGFGCQILACDPENKELIQQIDITYTKEVCKTQM